MILGFRKVLFITLLAASICGMQSAPVSAKPSEPFPDLSAPTPTQEGIDQESPIRDNDPRVVVKVDGSPITMGEINTTSYTVLHTKGLSPMTPEGQKELLSIRPNVFNTLVSLALLKQGVNKDGVKVDPKLVDQKIDLVKKRYPNEQAFLDALKKDKMTFEKYREVVTDEMRLLAAKEEIMAQGLKEPTESEMKEFYQAHKNAFIKPERVRLSILVIGYPDNPSAQQKSEAFSKINRLYFRIQGGEIFADLAKESSTGPNTEKGGDLGYKPRSFVEKYLGPNSNYKLTVGAVTPVLETPTGYILLYPTEIVPPTNITLEEAGKEVREAIRDRQKASNLQTWLENQNAKAKIEVVNNELYRLVNVSD